MDIVFDRNWFKREQNRLLWLLNHSTYFRKDLGIQECDLPHNVPITEITPNSFSWGDRYFERDGEWFLERTTDFRGTDKFARRMYYAFYPVWNIAHKFDLGLANRFAPALNLGFDTLTQYPWSIGTNNPVDGFCSMDDSGNRSWAYIRDGAGNYHSDGLTTERCARIESYANTNTWLSIARGIFCFDTSSLTSSATISASTFSIYYEEKSTTGATGSSINVYSSAPAATNSLSNGDFDSLGTTAFATAIAYASYAAGYNDFALNASGITNISKTGISKFGTREATYDATNTAPTWAYPVDIKYDCYYSNYTGTTRDPKLVVTYSVASAHFLTSLGVGK